MGSGRKQATSTDSLDSAPEAVVRRFFRALNERDYERAADAMAESCEYVSVPTGATFTGYHAVLHGLRAVTEAFPDWMVDAENLVVAGPFVVVEWRTAGTHEGEFRGVVGTGIRFDRRGCAVAEVADGKIVRYRDYYDRATLLEQLGLIDVL